MSISDTTENNILKLYFNATAIANIADNTATSADTNIAVALHTADPGDTGTQTTSETTYTSYARVNVARTTGGWTASSAGSTSPVANIDFPTGTGGSGSIGFFSTGRPSGGASIIFWSGSVSPSITAGTGVLPRLTTSTTITLD
jgi:hypothetical protein